MVGIIHPDGRIEHLRDDPDVEPVLDKDLERIVEQGLKEEFRIEPGAADRFRATIEPLTSADIEVLIRLLLILPELVEMLDKTEAQDIKDMADKLPNLVRFWPEGN